MTCIARIRDGGCFLYCCGIFIFFSFGGRDSLHMMDLEDSFSSSGLVTTVVERIAEEATSSCGRREQKTFFLSFSL